MLLIARNKNVKTIVTGLHILFRGHTGSVNAPAQARRASDLRLSTETRSRRSVQPIVGSCVPRSLLFYRLPTSLRHETVSAQSAADSKTQNGRRAQADNVHEADQNTPRRHHGNPKLQTSPFCDVLHEQTQEPHREQEPQAAEKQKQHALHSQLNAVCPSCPARPASEGGGALAGLAQTLRLN